MYFSETRCDAFALAEGGKQVACTLRFQLFCKSQQFTAQSPVFGAAGAAALLRTGQPAVVGRIADGRLLLDMLTVSDAELPELAEALKPVLVPPPTQALQVRRSSQTHSPPQAARLAAAAG